MRGAVAGMERAMRLRDDVGVRQAFDVVRLGGQWVPERVPIILNNFNRLTYLQRVVQSLQARGCDNIYVIDNQSTHEPLLEYYRSAGLKVFYLDQNVGYLALWTTSVGEHFIDDYYVYSDSDVMPAPECPNDFLSVFRTALDRHPRIGKVGFGLKISDLPEHYALRDDVVKNESRLLAASGGQGLYRAAIDTTFALYRPGVVGGSWIPALRTGEPYVAMHLPWYEDSANPSPEEQNYLRTIKTSTHYSLRAGDEREPMCLPFAGMQVRATRGPNDDLWNVVSRGEWKPDLLDAVDSFVRLGGCFVDVGGSPGPAIIYAARTGARVVALERTPERLSELDANLALNGPEVSTVVTALADTGSLSARELDVSACTLLSIDDPGRELKWLRSLRPVLERAKPAVHVELWPGKSLGLTTTSWPQKLLIALLGIIDAVRVVHALRAYSNIYLGRRPFGIAALLGSLSSHIGITATDSPWDDA